MKSTLLHLPSEEILRKVNRPGTFFFGKVHPMPSTYDAPRRFGSLSIVMRDFPGDRAAVVRKKSPVTS